MNSTEIAVLPRALAVAAAVALAPTLARAEDKKACATAYVQAQVQRQKGHLKAAREQLIECSHVCGADLRTDCGGWLREVEAALPTVVVEAIGPDGKETADVRVTCDGVELLARLDGRAVPIDPGPHDCRAEMAGEPARQEQILAHEGEQRRPWRVSFQRTAGAAGPVDPTPPPQTS